MDTLKQETGLSVSMPPESYAAPRMVPSYRQLFLSLHPRKANETLTTVYIGRCILKHQRRSKICIRNRHQIFGILNNFFNLRNKKNPRICLLACFPALSFVLFCLGLEGGGVFSQHPP